MACCKDMSANFVIPERAALAPLSEQELHTLLATTLASASEEDATLLFAALVEVRRAIVFHSASVLAALAQVEPFVVCHVGSLRSAVSRCAVIAAGELSKLCGEQICCREQVDAYVATLLVKASGDKKFIRDPAIEALRNLVAAPNPTALLFQALVRHSTSKNRSTQSLSAELAVGVLSRLTPAQTDLLDLESLARSLSSYNTSKSSEARTCARCMSEAVASARGVRAWRAAVTAVCREQDSRELLVGLGGSSNGCGEDEDGQEVTLTEDATDLDANKENHGFSGFSSLNSSVVAGTASAGPSCPATPVRFSLGGTGAGNGTVRLSANGRKSGGGMPLREFLREQSLVRSVQSARASLGGCATPASASASVGPGYGAAGTPKPGLLDGLAGRLSLGAPGTASKGDFTPLLVLQRTTSTPAMPLRSVGLTAAMNAVAGPVGAPPAAGAGGLCHAGSAESAESSFSDCLVVAATTALTPGGHGKQHIVLPVGEAAAALLEEWGVTY